MACLAVCCSIKYHFFTLSFLKQFKFICVCACVCIFPVMATHTQSLLFPDLISSSPNNDFLCVVFCDLVRNSFLYFFFVNFTISLMLPKIHGVDVPKRRMLLFIHSKGKLPGAAAQSNLEGRHQNRWKCSVLRSVDLQLAKATDKMISYQDS